MRRTVLKPRLALLSMLKPATKQTKTGESRSHMTAFLLFFPAGNAMGGRIRGEVGRILDVFLCSWSFPFGGLFFGLFVGGFFQLKSFFILVTVVYICTALSVGASWVHCLLILIWSLPLKSSLTPLLCPLVWSDGEQFETRAACLLVLL